MNRQQTNRFALLMAAFSLVGPLQTVSSALETDKNQEMLWSADGDSRMSIENGVRLVEMSDNVIITQGTLEIRGDAATIEYNISNNAVSRVTVTGSPAYYQQQLDSSDAPVKGSSRTLSFYSDEIDGTTVIELIGEAVIESPTANLRCSAIVYIAEQDLIREAPGPCSGVFNSTNR
ncbi:MAG: LptA/OstA family protein [Pseudohongiellaceae bacterium]